MSSKVTKDVSGPYDREYTRDLILTFQHEVSLCDMLRREGEVNPPPHSESVVDLDGVTKDAFKGSDRPKSVDFMVGLVGRRIRFVECKLRKNEKNQTEKELSDKVKYSKQRLYGTDHSGRVEKTTYILLDKSEAPLLQRRIRRKYPTRSARDIPYEAMTTSDFCRRLFDRS